MFNSSCHAVPAIAVKRLWMPAGPSFRRRNQSVPLARCPLVEHWLTPAPGGVGFIVTHEQRRIPTQNIEQQPLGRILPTLTERLLKVQVEIDPRKRIPSPGAIA